MVVIRSFFPLHLFRYSKFIRRLSIGFAVRNSKMNLQAEKVVKIYSETVCPTPSKARLLPSSVKDCFTVQSTWKHTDLSLIKYVTTESSHVCQWQDKGFHLISSNSHNIMSETLSVVSNSGDTKVILRKDEQTQFIEVYKNANRVFSYNMSEVKQHDDIYASGEFTTFVLNENEDKLLYVAEKKIPKSESYFKKKRGEKEENQDSSSEDLPVKGAENVYREDWGERHVKQSHSVLCVLDLPTGDITVLPEVKEDNVSVGQGIWSKDGKSIVFVGWYEDPYRLGIVFCQMRRNALFCYEMGSANPYLISSDKFSVYTPRFSPDGTFLLFLQNSAGGPHMQTNQLVRMDFKSKNLTVLVDVVKQCSKNEFPGLYTSLRERCFTSDGKYVFLSSSWRSKLVLLCINLENKSIEKVDIEDSIGSCSFLDVFHDMIVVDASAPNIQPHLIIGRFNFENGKVNVKWNPLTFPKKLDDLKWNIETLQPTEQNKNFPGLDYEILVVSPKKINKSIPLIIIPHGGPHSCYEASYVANTAAFVRSGFVVCKVNYRGSIGFGENNLYSLPGNVGKQDVQDVHFAAEYMKKTLSASGDGNTEVKDIFLLGGSHGGFLACHLSGQYPDYYKACVALNPVIDMSSMVCATDIPDWTWIEAGSAKFTFEEPDLHLRNNMFHKSPINYVKDVKLPTLLLIGCKDRRVPPEQGFNYFRALKARKVPVSLYVYDDNHSLRTNAAVDTDSFMQMIMFLLKHCTVEKAVE